MGRPKNADLGPIPTREQLLRAAMTLFAERGYDAVSVRDITGALGLNEASLYNHYKGKGALFETILKRLDERLIEPVFTPLPQVLFEGNESFDLTDFLVRSAGYFFGRTDHETIMTWRILMINQYRYPGARDSMRDHILDAPRRFFTDVLHRLSAAGRIAANADCGALGAVISSVFFEFAFRSNLDTAWDEEPTDVEVLRPLFEAMFRGLDQT